MTPLMADERLPGTFEDPSPRTIVEGVLRDLEPEDLEPEGEGLGINILKPGRRRRGLE